MREAYGLPRVAAFDEITRDPSMQAKLAAAYEHVDDIDLWVGGLAEEHVPGGLVGETFRAILVDQFTRLRDGDRFWYEAYLGRRWADTIRRETLSRIIQRNTDLDQELQRNVFIVP